MNFLDTWRLLSARIRGLTEAAKLDAVLRPNAPSATGSTAYLFQQCDEIFRELADFNRMFADTLPKAAVSVLDDAARLHAPLVQSSAPEPNRGLTGNALVHLQAIESALTFSLSGTEERVLSLTERALQHLQRSLIVDDTLRKKWLEAFDEREEKIESLGAVHLLAHGIYAFKVNAKGAQTDLVIPDSLPIDASRYASGIVLTEWKLARGPIEAPKKFREARKQAALYASGPLASVELRSTRYVIVVTKQGVECPPDEQADGVHYRNKNISLTPQPPSKAAMLRRSPRARPEEARGGLDISSAGGEAHE
jgi:hypothetical protein